MKSGMDGRRFVLPTFFIFFGLGLQPFLLSSNVFLFELSNIVNGVSLYPLAPLLQFFLLIFEHRQENTVFVFLCHYFMSFLLVNHRFISLERLYLLFFALFFPFLQLLHLLLELLLSLYSLLFFIFVPLLLFLLKKLLSLLLVVL